MDINIGGNYKKFCNGIIKNKKYQLCIKVVSLAMFMNT